MNITSPPKEVHALANWFAEAVRAELVELEKNSGERKYELLTGRRITPEKSLHTIYCFTLADTSVVPEESKGIIEIGNSQFRASVVGQETDRIDVEIDGGEVLGTFVSRAILCVDDLAPLRKLAEILEAIARGEKSASALASGIFHPERNGASTVSLPSEPSLNLVRGEQRAVIEQALGSEITFVWGPPGTGKTYVIAHLIAALIARGERVLMTSHTHAAVDQSMYEMVKSGDDPESQSPGPLSNSSLECEGKIVRIGRVTNIKVPPSVRLDDIVKNKAQEIQTRIDDLQQKVATLSTKRTPLNTQLAQWDRLEELQRRFVESDDCLNEALALVERSTAEQERVRTRERKCRESVERAARAWFFKTRKIERAEQSLAAAAGACAISVKQVSEFSSSVRDAEQMKKSLQAEVKTQADICNRLPTVEALREQLAPLNSEIDEIERSLNDLTARLDAIIKNVIADARVVAATLTKCYFGNELDGESFDALIVDEISMALPPLLFVAARQTLRRVILVGDFKQLPPIVRTDNEVADQRLRKDAFHLARIAIELDPTDHPALARLRTQRRMMPPIADAARYISYGPNNLLDHADVSQRIQPDWLSFLPSSALVIVDTADLYCWCGRKAGSLSRFNLYSAHISVELAAMAASAIARKNEAVSRKIGIVTPYAAQRRLLSRLIQALGLTDWIVPGTIHTFQGGEAELIIFDTVLDEPYWSARLCNPKQSAEVKRDLNVALTRARMKFILIGSSEWLNHHAKPASGLGQLWHYMKDHADLVSAHDIVEARFIDRVGSSIADAYRVPDQGGIAVHEILDDTTFFDQFATDLQESTQSIVGLVPFFGEYRWPTVEPLLLPLLGYTGKT